MSETAIQVIRKYKHEIKRVSPENFGNDKLERILTSQINANPELGLCDITSLMVAVMHCAQLGLYPGTANPRIYLIPFENRKKEIKEVNVIVDYRGLVELAKRSRNILDFYTEVVYENDDFHVQRGTDKKLHHIDAKGGERGDFYAVYAVVKYTNGGSHWELMYKNQIEAIRNRPKYPNKIWNTDYEEMARKTVIRRISKMLDLNPEEQKQMAIADHLQSSVELNASQDNELLLIEGGAKGPIYNTPQQKPGIENIKHEATKALQQLSSEKVREVFRKTKTEVLEAMVDEASALDIFTMIKSIEVKNGEKKES